MICAPCKNRRHDECPTVENHIHDPDSGFIRHIPAKDKTWCDCQHRSQHKARVAEIGDRIAVQDAEILARLKEEK